MLCGKWQPFCLSFNVLVKGASGGICDTVALADISRGMVDYCQTSNTSHTLVGNKIVDRSDVVGASPVSAAPTTSPFST